LQNLRPETWEEFIGHERIKALLRSMKHAAKTRNEPLEPILFFGPSGCGKTTLARLLAENSRCLEVPCPLLREDELKEALFKTRRNGFLILDEIHSLRKELQIALLDVLEERKTFGRRYTYHGSILACTTKVSELALPLRQRFEEIWVGDYSREEIVQIVMQAAPELGLALDKEVAKKIADFARGIPRRALRILRRVRDIVVCTGKDAEAAFFGALVLLGLDTSGLDEAERAYLKALSILPQPVGIANIAKILGIGREEAKSLEGFLIRSGLLIITKRGRMLTKKGEQLYGQIAQTKFKP